MDNFRVADPRFPWLVVGKDYPAPRTVLMDTRTMQAWLLHEYPGGLPAFIADHSAAQGHGGLGDLVRSVTKFLGFGACEPCAKRQTALNAAAPSVFRRR
jgi:hypothetical protein